MAEKKRLPNEKNPVGAAVLSTIPGLGFFYLGNVVKAVAYILIFISLIVLEVESRRALEHTAFGLMIAGFYIFQIIDSYNEAKKINERQEIREEAREEVVTNGEEKISLFWSVTILVVGIVFQLIELDVFRFRDVTRLWPIFLIALGARYIYTYTLGSREEGSENGGEK